MRLIPRLPLSWRSPAPRSPGAEHPARRSLRRRHKLAIVAAVIALLLTSSSPAAAQPLQVLAAEDSFEGVLGNVRNWIMGLAALLATVMLSVGAVIRMMATGDPGEIERSNRAFKSAGWGYGIAALAPLIVAVLQGIVGE